MFTSFNARALGLNLSVEETLQLASENGFGGVDVMIRDAFEANVDFHNLKRRLDDLGLKPGAFPLPFDWRTTDETAFARDLESLRIYAQAAAILGLTRTATWVMPEVLPTVGSHVSSPDDTFRFHASRLAQIARILDSFGIHVGLEVIGVESSRSGNRPAFIHRLDQLERLRREVETISTAEVGVLIDSWHLYAADESIAQALAWGTERIVWVHVADLPMGGSTDRTRMIDAIRGLPGEHGAIDNPQLLRDLKLRGYTGPVTAEPLSQCRSLCGLQPRHVASLASASLANIWPD